MKHSLIFVVFALSSAYAQISGFESLDADQKIAAAQINTVILESLKKPLRLQLDVDGNAKAFSINLDPKNDAVKVNMIWFDPTSADHIKNIHDLIASVSLPDLTSSKANVRRRCQAYAFLVPSDFNFALDDKTLPATLLQAQDNIYILGENPNQTTLANVIYGYDCRLILNDTIKNY